jgi:hypothetical protein
LVSSSSSGQKAPDNLAGEQLDSLGRCTSPSLPVRLARAHLVWKEGLLQVVVSSPSGKLALFQGPNLLIFTPDVDTSREVLPMKSGVAALAMSDGGTLGILQENKDRGRPDVQFHIHFGTRDSIGPPIQLQPWKVPQTWPLLYSIGEDFYILEQAGKLTKVNFDGTGIPSYIVQMPPSRLVDLTAPLEGGGYFQYRWNVAAKRGPFATSSVTLFPNLHALQTGDGVRTPITAPVTGWRASADRVIFLTNRRGSGIDQRVHLVRKSDGREIASLEYLNEFCDVRALDASRDGTRVFVLESNGLIQVIDTSDLRLVAQIVLPQTEEFAATSTITAIASDKFLVTTARGVALVDVSGAK